MGKSLKASGAGRMFTDNIDFDSLSEKEFMDLCAESRLQNLQRFVKTGKVNNKDYNAEVLSRCFEALDKMPNDSGFKDEESMIDYCKEVRREMWEEYYA
jgi:hypothetical protein